MRKLRRRFVFMFLPAVLSFLLGCILTSNIMFLYKTCEVPPYADEEYVRENSKVNNPELIILILSAPGNLDKRNTVRNTWLKLPDPEGNEQNHFQFKHYFVVGELGLSLKQIHDLKTEQSTFNDISILPLYDSYKNLTKKVGQSFQWLSKQSDYGSSFKYVLKCDDDSFVNLRDLISELTEIDKIIRAGNSMLIMQDQRKNHVSFNIQKNDATNISYLNLYWGYFSGNARIKTKGKWKEINWIASDYYLPYALGGGYVLSKDLVNSIAKTYNNLRSFNSEDVSVGIWLAPIDNIIRIHDTRFDTEWTSRGCKNTHLVTHNVSSTEMKKLFNNMKTFGKLCSTEVTKRKHYIYDWKVPSSQCCRISGETDI